MLVEDILRMLSLDVGPWKEIGGLVSRKPGSDSRWLQAVGSC